MTRSFDQITQLWIYKKNVLWYLYRLAQIVSYISYRINISVAALPKKVWLWVKFTSMLYLVAVFRMVEISCSVLKYTFLDALASLEPILFTQSVSAFFWIADKSARVDAYSQCLHLFGFSPLCDFKCLLKSSAREDIKSHWLHLFDFSPLCVFKRFFKSPA